MADSIAPQLTAEGNQPRSSRLQIYERTGDYATLLRELLDAVGGIRAGHHLKFWTPG